MQEHLSKLQWYIQSHQIHKWQNWEKISMFWMSAWWSMLRAILKKKKKIFSFIYRIPSHLFKFLAFKLCSGLWDSITFLFYMYLFYACGWQREEESWPKLRYFTVHLEAGFEDLGRNLGSTEINGKTSMGQNFIPGN